MGYQSLYEYISKKLGITFGGTSADERFTLLPISCLGDCDNAPAMMINNDHFNRLTADKIDELLERYK
jgi:NADH-quinone oxidoreductase subunit E